jgi:uncharacterized protein (TIGR03437 family)
MRNYQSRFLPLSAALLAMAFAPAGPAQTGTQTTIQASPTGPWFMVDGTTFYNPMSAFWPVGSLHTLAIPQGTGFSYNFDLTVQWQFQGWSWNGGTSSALSMQVVANPAITNYTANYAQLYKFTTQVACNPAPCTGVPGAILINGTAAGDASFQSPGASESLSVISNNGWIFSGWQVGNSPLVTSVVYSVTLDTPKTVTAVFVPAKSVSFVTNPANLEIYVDGTLMTTPNTLQWGLGTSHTIGQLNVTNDNTGKRWVFGSWSDGGAQTHTYVVGKNYVPETVTATYAAAAYPFFTTSPPNLALVVDKLVLPPPYSYIWGVGSTHTITATSPQKDSQGTTWIFQSWGDGATTPTRSFTIPVGADDATGNGFSMVALYSKSAAQLTVNSTISAQVVTVDGSPCTTPCTISRTPGTQVHVSAPSSVPAGTNSRQDFLGWSTNSGSPVAGDWVAALNTASTSIMATYHVMNSLTTAATPPRGAAWRFSPSSPDGFYDAQTKVELRVEAKPGFRFTGWGGDLSGSNPRASLTMNVPHVVTAALVSAPFISRGGVTNSAGAGEIRGVAAGSVASLFGENFTAESMVGPTSPLAHTLAGVTVHIGTRSLPLYFASPTQINFLIPADLATGDHVVTVSSEGMPDVTSAFSVVRNAPGLFSTVADGQTYAMVMHEDGTPVTASAPARQGELLTAYGTGFGPTDHVRSEGGIVPSSPRFLLLDPVTIEVGGNPVKPESAIAAPGRVGIDSIQFRLDGTTPTGAAIPVTVTVNGVRSNSLVLSIQ